VGGFVVEYSLLLVGALGWARLGLALFDLLPIFLLPIKVEWSHF